VAKPETDSRYREYARETIEAVLAQRPELLNAHPREVRKELADHYPFGERAHWPYKCWLTEVNLALYGPEPGKGARVPPPEQPSLFPEEEAPRE
jgi:hypothetical protein